MKNTIYSVAEFYIFNDVVTTKDYYFFKSKEGAKKFFDSQREFWKNLKYDITNDEERNFFVAEQEVLFGENITYFIGDFDTIKLVDEIIKIGDNCIYVIPYLYNL